MQVYTPGTVDEIFYTVNEFALIRRVHRDTVSRWIKEKRILAVNQGTVQRPLHRIPGRYLHAFEPVVTATSPPPPARPKRRQRKYRPRINLG